MTDTAPHPPALHPARGTTAPTDHHAATASTWTALRDHCATVEAPFVLVSGPSGFERAQYIASAIPPTDVNLLVSGHVDAELLRRRLRIFSEAESPQAAVDLLLSRVAGALSDDQGSAPHRHLIVPQADQLDEDSLRVLELLIRSHRVGLLMTASATSYLSRRFSSVLAGERGMHVALRPMTTTETEALLDEVLEEPPVPALTRYLRTCCDGAPGNIAAIARRGADEGWIGRSGSRSVFLAPPIWLDRPGSQMFVEELCRRFGPAVVDVLRDLAVRESLPWQDLLSDRRLREAILHLEEARLVDVDRDSARIRRPAHRQLLIMSGGEPVEACTTPSGVLHLRVQGRPVDPSRARPAAWELLERGMIAQARLVAGALPLDHPDRDLLEACCELASGVPCPAVTTLRAVSARSHAPAPRALARLVEAVSLGDVSAGAASLEHAWADVVPAVDELDAETPDAGPPDVRHLAELLASALDAARSAAVVDDDEACRRLDDVGSRPAEQVPIIGADWLVGVLGCARLLLRPEEECPPSDWFPGETPERRALRANTTAALELTRALLCGEPVEELRRRLEDLRDQLSTRMPQGIAAQPLLSALSHAVETRAHDELLDPPCVSLTYSHRPDDPQWIRMIAATGTILRAVRDGRVVDVEQALETLPAFRPHRRAALRCVILRGVRDWPDAGLDRLHRLGEDVGVEQAVLELVAARRAGDAARLDHAVERLAGSHPGFRVSPPAVAETPRHRPVAGDLQPDEQKLAPLSSREREVALRTLQGTRHADVADALRISERTVQSHVRNIYRKLGVGARTELRALLLDDREEPRR